MSSNIEQQSVIINMDFIQKSGVKIPNAVLVSGITQVPEQDEQVLDFLKQYGKIDRVLLVEDQQSEFFQNLIVEYSSGSAIETLEPHLPYTYTTQGEFPSLYEVKPLSSTYTTKVGCNVTKTYLTELKRLAKMSGKNYGEVLKEMMSQIGVDIEAMQHTVDEPTSAHVETTAPSIPTYKEPPHISLPNVTPNGHGDAAHTTLANAKRAPSLSLSDVNPPDIQKVVVEHIVRSQDAFPHMQSQVRLRSFSGKTPIPNHETDYDTWRTHIEMLQNDPSMSPLQISRKILENLLSPAVDVVKGLLPGSPPTAYLQLLDSAYGTVADGEELFAQFLNTLQDPGEKSSAYLQRLQLALNHATRRGGVTPKEGDKHILKQFCRGCWDNTLISTLQLEQKKNSPPHFSDLLLMIRSEEDRQEAKSTRMKRHMGITKQKAQVHYHDVYVLEPEENTGAINVIEDLRKQVASLQSQLTTFMSQKKTQGANHKGSAGRPQNRTPKTNGPDTSTNRQSVKTPTNKPRPWYCFNCGEDGHIAPCCTDPANPRLVAEKKRQLQERQQQWEARNGSSLPLND